MIAPTVGRIVHYRPGPDDGIPHDSAEPLAAIVAAVNSERDVNLCVFRADGMPVPRSNVRLVQEGELVGADTTAAGWCEWMPYQKGQAAKTEAAEAALARASDAVQPIIAGGPGATFPENGQPAS